ncbi:endoribonuclease L-PSP [Desulfuromusa kysingii]|uniref:Endoribonuclease L-PSP n=1 Tax=Desulfuromusa kysingii TaxID=37625 RepID=A0A1H4CYX9_9BACT|nr:RidA family protein [Desulfuromusa kysingii]SEA65508.1 endoribonuclease L-PSP [Desulfuromusa kysingii]
MNLVKIDTAKAPAAIGPYSQAIKAGGFLYCSGQIPLIPSTGDLISGGIEEQTKQSLNNLQNVLIEAGVDFNAVVKTTIYLTDLSDFATVNEIYADYCGEVAPARVTVQVAALPKGALIEIDAIACA